MPLTKRIVLIAFQVALALAFFCSQASSVAQIDATDAAAIEDLCSICSRGNPDWTCGSVSSLNACDNKGGSAWSGLGCDATGRVTYLYEPLCSLRSLSAIRWPSSLLLKASSLFKILVGPATVARWVQLFQSRSETSLAWRTCADILHIRRLLSFSCETFRSEIEIESIFG